MDDWRELVERIRNLTDELNSSGSMSSMKTLRASTECFTTADSGTGPQKLKHVEAEASSRPTGSAARRLADSRGAGA
jgi:hypothetical protein